MFRTCVVTFFTTFHQLWFSVLWLNFFMFLVIQILLEMPRRPRHHEYNNKYECFIPQFSFHQCYRCSSDVLTQFQTTIIQRSIFKIMFFTIFSILPYKCGHMTHGSFFVYVHFVFDMLVLFNIF